MLKPNTALSKMLLWLPILFCLMLVVVLVGACGAATPSPAPVATLLPTDASEAAAPTPEAQIRSATRTVAPSPVVVDLTPAPVETSVPLTTELKATVAAGLPPTPTPGASGSSAWGDVAVLPLIRSDDGPPLWAAYSVGMGFYEPDEGHFVSIYGFDDGLWRELDSVVLTDCTEFVNHDSLAQVFLEPDHVWLEMDSVVGAHSGCYELLSFDGQTLHREVAHSNSSPGAGGVDDLDGDGIQEAILDWSDYYVFCYACGVVAPRYQVLRWDGGKLVEVELSPMPAAAPADLRRLNDHAVALARAGLWRDARQSISEALDHYAGDPNLDAIVDWNEILIKLHAEAHEAQVLSGVYPLMEYALYGDFEAAVDVMRPYGVEDIWTSESPLVVDTVADEWSLSHWLSNTTNLALSVQPDLAPAYLLRGWAAYLDDPGDPAILTDVEQAATLAPDDPLLAASLAHLAGTAPVEDELLGIYEPLAPDKCVELGQAMMQTLGVTVTIQDAPFEDIVGGDTGTGCLLSATATGAEFGGLVEVSSALSRILSQRGWDDDFLYAADGPTGTARGFHRGDGLCLLNVTWEPSAEAECPADRPLSECALVPEQQLYTANVHCARAPDYTVPPEQTTPTPVPTPTEAPAVQDAWQVRTLLAGPGEPGRLYALLTEESAGAWPAGRAQFLISDDYGQTWAPFPGGLPEGDCVRNVNLDYATADALYASTCQGLYRWSGSEWVLISPQETGMVAVVYGQPDIVWATAPFSSDGAAVLRSDDGGVTWQPASYGLVHFNGIANLGIDPRDANLLYAIIWPKYAGSYLRRGTAQGWWDTMPTPMGRAQIDTGMTLDGATGELYVIVWAQDGHFQLWRTLNPAAPDLDAVQWERVHDFGRDVQVELLASGWGPDGLALYAQIWPVTWLDEHSIELGDAVLHRSLDGGETWAPLPLP